MKIDKRKNYYVTFDTETVGVGDKALIYDIGYTIADKKGQVLLKVNHLVKEIFENDKLMEEAYYNEKIPKYKQMVKDGKIDIMHYKDIMKELQENIQYIEKFKALCAYNIDFDLGALVRTTELLYPSKFQMFFKKTKRGKFAPDFEKFVKFHILKNETVEIYDLWSMSCQVLCNQVTFQKYYAQFTERGNFKSNAEIVYNYITDQKDFIEEHTALSDAEIETEILARLIRAGLPKIKNAIFMPFRLIEVTQ